MSRSLKNLLLTCGSLLLCLHSGTALWGQAVNSAEIAGVVTDSSGAAVPSATVKAIQIETQLTRATDSGGDGAYALPNLPVERYSLEVAAAALPTSLSKCI